jgi:hypothetical protein
MYTLHMYLANPSGDQCKHAHNTYTYTDFLQFSMCPYTRNEKGVPAQAPVGLSLGSWLPEQAIVCCLFLAQHPPALY